MVNKSSGEGERPPTDSSSSASVSHGNGNSNGGQIEREGAVHQNVAQVPTPSPSSLPSVVRRGSAVDEDGTETPSNTSPTSKGCADFCFIRGLLSFFSIFAYEPPEDVEPLVPDSQSAPDSSTGKKKKKAPPRRQVVCFDREVLAARTGQNIDAIGSEHIRPLGRTFTAVKPPSASPRPPRRSSSAGERKPKGEGSGGEKGAKKDKKKKKMQSKSHDSLSDLTPMVRKDDLIALRNTKKEKTADKAILPETQSNHLSFDHNTIVDADGANEEDLMTSSPDETLSNLSHTEVRTYEELSLAVDRLATLLPFRVEVDTTTADATPAMNSKAGEGSGAIEFNLHLIGPLKRMEACGEAMDHLETILLDDCITDALKLVEVHVVDMSFSCLEYPKASDVAGASVVPTVSHPTEASTLSGESDNDRSSDIDSLPPLFGIASNSKTRRKLENKALLSREALVSRFCGFLTNVLMESTTPLRSLRFTRCAFAPVDLSTHIRMPLKTLESLLFERCPLIDASVTALLSQAREQNTCASSVKPGEPQAANSLQHVKVLQLSGSLTKGAVTELTSYLQNEAGGGEDISLRTLRVPRNLVTTVQQSFLVSNSKLAISVEASAS